MTTTVDPDDQSPPFETWRAIGRLEGQTAALLEGQREIKAAIRETNAALDTGLRQVRTDMDAGLRQAKVDRDSGLREVNRRIDRLLYAMLALGSALVVAVFASRFIGS